MPSLKDKTTPSTSLDSAIAGYENDTVPFTESSTGAVKTSPSGRLNLPSQLIHFLPLTDMVRSVSLPTMRN